MTTSFALASNHKYYICTIIKGDSNNTSTGAGPALRVNGGQYTDDKTYTIGFTPNVSQ